MIYAKDLDGKKITASPNGKATCPYCNSELIAKCGHINIHHWAHKVKVNECPFKQESAWHLKWKSLFKKERCEVRIEKNGKVKIADGVLPNGKVVEFQNSPISWDEIKEREAFYDNMCWVFNCREPYKEERFYFLERKKGFWYYQSKVHPEINHNEHQKYFCFKWKHARKSIMACEKPVYLDLGEDILRLIYLEPRKYHSGVGVLRPKEDLHNYILGKRIEKTKFQNYSVVHHR